MDTCSNLYYNPVFPAPMPDSDAVCLSLTGVRQCAASLKAINKKLSMNPSS